MSLGKTLDKSEVWILGFGFVLKQNIAHILWIDK